MKHNGRQIDMINQDLYSGKIGYEEAITRLAKIADRLNKRDRNGKHYTAERLIKSSGFSSIAPAC